MTKLRVLLAILSLLVVALPATAETVPVHAACANPDGRTLVSPSDRFSGTVETPIGAASEGIAGDAGAYIIDLAGLPQSSKAKVSLTLSAEAVGLVTDYDLVINGSNAETVGTPETHDFANTTHCATFDLETVVFFGTPLDTLNLDIKVTP